MILKKFWEHIERSIISGVSKKVSTTRISSYLILGSILTTSLIYLIIDIVNAIIKWSNGEIFVLSAESLVFFGMILTHHLALLGINKNAETKQYLDFLNNSKESKRASIKSKGKDSNLENSTDIDTGTGTEEEMI